MFALQEGMKIMKENPAVKVSLLPLCPDSSVRQPDLELPQAQCEAVIMPLFGDLEKVQKHDL